MIQGNFKIRIISQSNELIVEKDIVKYEWITENKINVYDKDSNITKFFLGNFLLIIETTNKDKNI